MSTRVIQVRIWDHEVGAIAADPNIGHYAFQYEPSWIQTGIELSPLMMPLDSRHDTYIFPNLLEPTFHRLPGLPADSLPDAFGNALIDAWMAKHGVARNQVTTLDRLAYMAKRGMGALEFKPERSRQVESAASLAMKTLVEEARKLVKGHLSGDALSQSALKDMIRVGTSAGGARPKAVIAWNSRTNEIRSGQFDVASGFAHWIVKFDGVAKDSAELGPGGPQGRIEFAYYKMATQAGIDMAQCSLFEENDRAHFMTRRFDREVVKRQTIKHHLQTLCAMNHMDYKLRETHAYAQLFIVISQLSLGDDAIDQVFRRMAFNVMARNCDDHTKNFSFVLKHNGKWELSPAYDVTHAHDPNNIWLAQHLMSVNGKFDDITREDLLAEADRFGVRRPNDLLADVRGALDNWTAHADSAGMTTAAAEEVAADFQLL